MIQRALISVYDKTGIVNFAERLSDLNIEIISTGGTFNLLKENNIKVKSVEEITGFPEVLSGRVKTLHPNIFAGILADRNNQDHINELNKYNIRTIDLVVVNLYPFEQTISKSGASIESAIEQIDIGGVSLIRAAAKNFKDVSVLVSPYKYGEYIDALKDCGNNISYSYSQKLALAAFQTTSDYDRTIRNYFEKVNLPAPPAADEISLKFPEILNSNTKSVYELRYGENPHQKALLAKEDFDEVFHLLHGKELSYNNILDIDAAYNLVNEFEDEGPMCAIIKHGNPSGAAISSSLLNAYINAYKTDTLSPFGGIIIFNKKLDFKTSMEVDKLFSEIILAPDFDIDALELLKKKKNRRLIKFNFGKEINEFRKVSGGILYQQKNNHELKKEDLRFVTKRKATDSEIKDMLFAFAVVKHTKSNAIVFVKGKSTLGIGGGQPSRIDSTKLAISKAREYHHELRDSIAASDAFFPFADGLIELAKTGACAVIQPGGSVRDDEIIKAADDLNLAMAFTGIRHFKH